MPPQRSNFSAHRPLIVCLVALAALLLPAMLTAADATAISGKIFNDYAREKMPDGKFKPEYYVIGEGGRWMRPIDDPGMEKFKFPDIVRTVAGPLAKLNYQPAPHVADAGLLILLYWGSTEGSLEYGDDGTFRAMLDERNARILGYSDELMRTSGSPFVPGAHDIKAELGANRYYVVLQAYDFKTALKEKKLKPLWVTRMSLNEKGAFAPALAKMVQDGSSYFGHDSDGLLRHGPERQGTVKLGPLDIIETVPAGTDKSERTKP